MTATAEALERNRGQLRALEHLRVLASKPEFSREKGIELTRRARSRVEGRPSSFRLGAAEALEALISQQTAESWPYIGYALNPPVEDVRQTGQFIRQGRPFKDNVSDTVEGFAELGFDPDSAEPSELVENTPRLITWWTDPEGQDYEGEETYPVYHARTKPEREWLKERRENIQSYLYDWEIGDPRKWSFLSETVEALVEFSDLLWRQKGEEQPGGRLHPAVADMVEVPAAGIPTLEEYRALLGLARELTEDSAAPELVALENAIQAEIQKRHGDNGPEPDGNPPLSPIDAQERVTEAGEDSTEKTPFPELASLEVHLAGRLVDAGSYVENEPPVLNPIISGLFERGDKVALLAPSKMKKTFFLSQLAISLATGQAILGQPVRHSRRVLFVNMEVRDRHAHRRVKRMAKALDVLPDALRGRLLIFNARGLAVEWRELLDIVKGAAESMRADVIILDPLYKVVDGDENASGDMKPVLKAFDELAETTDAAIIYAHHDAKGNAGDRDIRDRGAGSGVLGRDYDCGITLTRHKTDPEATVIQFLPRNYPEPPSVAVRFENNHFVLANDLEPEAATSRGGGAGKPTPPTAGQLRDTALEVFKEKTVWTKPDLKTAIADRLTKGVDWVTRNLWAAVKESEGYHEERVQLGVRRVELVGSDFDTVEREAKRLRVEYEEERQREL